MSKTKKPTVVFLDKKGKLYTKHKSQFKSDYKVVQATEPEALLALLAGDSPESQVDVLVCEQRLKDTTGVEFLRLVEEISPKTAKVLLTGFSDIPASFSCSDLGCMCCYLTKPYEAEQLQEAVEDVRKLAKKGKIAEQKKENLLLAGQSKKTVHCIEEAFKNQHRIFLADTVDEFIKLLKKEKFAVIVTNDKIKDKNIIPLVKTFEKTVPDTQIILIARLKHAEKMVKLAKTKNIYRALPHPPSYGLLKISIARAFEQHRKLNPTVEPQT